MNKSNIVTMPRGERVSIGRENMTPKSIANNRKKLDVVIIQTKCGIEIIRGIRAGIIRDAYHRDDYHGVFHWPIRKNRSIENIVVLCNVETGNYSIKKGLAAARVRNKTPQGYEIEFAYFKPKRKKVKKIRTPEAIKQQPVATPETQQKPGAEK